LLRGERLSLECWTKKPEGEAPYGGVNLDRERKTRKSSVFSGGHGKAVWEAAAGNGGHGESVDDVQSWTQGLRARTAGSQRERREETS